MSQQRKIKVATEKGMMSVPASGAVDCIPHLAVTMTSFGQFEVTHAPSGYRLIGGFERVVNAFVSMVQLQLALNELDIDASGSREEFKVQINEKDKECGSLGMTIRQWIALCTTVGNICSEFPWEGGDEGPHAELEKLLKQLKQDRKEKSAFGYLYS